MDFIRDALHPARHVSSFMYLAIQVRHVDKHTDLVNHTSLHFALLGELPEPRKRALGIAALVLG